MENNKKDSTFTIRGILLIFCCIFALSSIIFASISTQDDKWINRALIAIISFGFYGVIKAIKDK